MLGYELIVSILILNLVENILLINIWLKCMKSKLKT